MSQRGAADKQGVVTKVFERSIATFEKSKSETKKQLFESDEVFERFPFITFGYVTLRYVMLRYVTICYVMLRHVTYISSVEKCCVTRPAAPHQK